MKVTDYQWALCFPNGAVSYDPNDKRSHVYISRSIARRALREEQKMSDEKLHIEKVRIF